jgi:hypothetical protein
LIVCYRPRTVIHAAPTVRLFKVFKHCL